MWRFVGLVSAWLLLIASAPPAHAADNYELRLYPEDFRFSPGAGRSSPTSVVLWSTGAASAYVDTADVVGSLEFEVFAQQCEGAPHLQVAVDGVTRLTQEVHGEGHYGVTVDWRRGRHKVTFRFLDDRRTASCDRNVVVRETWLDLTSPGGYVYSIHTGQSLLPRHITVAPATAGNVTPERGKLTGNGSMRFRLDSQYATYLFLGVNATGCDGRMAHLVVTVDGTVVFAGAATQGTNWVTAHRPYPDGAHDFVLTVSGDPNTPTCDGFVALVATDFFGQSPA